MQWAAGSGQCCSRQLWCAVHRAGSGHNLPPACPAQPQWTNGLGPVGKVTQGWRADEAGPGPTPAPTLTDRNAHCTLLSGLCSNDGAGCDCILLSWEFRFRCPCVSDQPCSVNAFGAESSLWCWGRQGETATHSCSRRNHLRKCPLLPSTSDSLGGVRASRDPWAWGLAPRFSSGSHGLSQNKLAC